MDATTYKNFCDILNQELMGALGCTEPIALAYAAALARRVLGQEASHLEIGCSGNMIKNVKSVTVPNSDGMHGIEAAAVLGMVGGNSDNALEVLQSVTPDDIAHAKEVLGYESICNVSLVEDVPNLYIRVVACEGDHSAEVVVAEHHTNVILVKRDGEVLHEGNVYDSNETGEQIDRSGLSVENIVEFARELNVDDIRDILQRQCDNNDAISKEGLCNPWGAQVGRTLLDSRPECPAARACARAAAGSDARMSGCSMPVTIVCGSGNQGITACMPVMEYAEVLGKSHDEMLAALAMADLIAVHLKSYIGSLSAFCGAVCAAAGAGAAITFMRGGDVDQIGLTITNTLGNVGGIVCDGAKASCASKIAAAVDSAILASDMAMVGRGFESGDGLVQENIEKSIAAMGYVGRVGMKATDVEILNIMIGKTDVYAGC